MPNLTQFGHFRCCHIYTASLIFNKKSPVADTEYKLLQIINELDVFINLKPWLGIWNYYEMTSE